MSKPPNIVCILIDDLGWRDLACYGSSFYETPHLDALAARGIRFTDAYASCPVCSPTRASVMTGKYPARVGITNFIGGNDCGRLDRVPYLDHLPGNETTIADALREGGYQTWHVGKWHLGGDDHEPQHRGFDVNVGGCGWGMPKQGYFSPWGIRNLEDGPEGEYLTDRLTDETLALIAGRDRDRPFFLHLAHYAVHTPIQAPAEKVEYFREKAARLGLDRERTFAVGEEFPCLHKRGKRVTRRLLQSDPEYAAMIANLDDNLGRVVAAIDEAGIAEDTLIVFTSDNGGLATAEGSPTCNRPLAEGKGWMYDGGTRVCQFAVWPGTIAAGSECAVPVSTPDLYPTFLEAAGLPPRGEQHVDGESLMPLLRGDGELAREAIFWHYPHYGNQGGTPGSSIRRGRWKLIEFFDDGRRELYDMNDDPGEERDRAAGEPDLVEDLAEALATWRVSVSARIPEPNPRYETLMAIPLGEWDPAFV